jgi:hypothetical protein
MSGQPRIVLWIMRKAYAYLGISSSSVGIFQLPTFDGLVKSLKIPFSIIPAKAGIQSFQAVVEHMDSDFHRSDDFLRIHQHLGYKLFAIVFSCHAMKFIKTNRWRWFREGRF